MGFAAQKQRIAGIDSIQKMCQAVYMIANAKQGAASRRVAMARAFAEPFEKLLEVEDPEPIPEKGSGKKLELGSTNRGHFHLTLVSGDRGLCGSFNTTVVRTGLNIYRNSLDRDSTTSIDIIGKKAARKMTSNAGEHINRSFVETNKLKVPTFSQAMMIGEYLASLEFDFGYVIYNKYISTTTFALTKAVQRSKAKDKEHIEKHMRHYSIEGGNDIVENLLDFRSAALLWNYCIDSSAAEFTARANSMNGASQSTQEMIRELTVEMNRTRQGKITRDLCELVAGVEAMKEE